MRWYMSTETSPIETQVRYIMRLLRESGFPHDYVCEALECAAVQTGAKAATCVYRYDASATTRGEYFMLRFTMPKHGERHVMKL